MKTQDKGGRPAHAPDDRSRQMVEVLSGFGIPQDKIADVIGVDGKTLRKHYALELQRGAANGRGEAGREPGAARIRALSRDRGRGPHAHQDQEPADEWNLRALPQDRAQRVLSRGARPPSSVPAPQVACQNRPDKVAAQVVHREEAVQRPPAPGRPRARRARLAGAPAGARQVSRAEAPAVVRRVQDRRAEAPAPPRLARILRAAARAPAGNGRYKTCLLSRLQRSPGHDRGFISYEFFAVTMVPRGGLGNINRHPKPSVGTTQSPYVVVADPDAVYARAKAAGAKIVIDIKDEDYGGRGFSCLDPEGHLWNIGSYDPWTGATKR